MAWEPGFALSAFVVSPGLGGIAALAAAGLVWGASQSKTNLDREEFARKRRDAVAGELIDLVATVQEQFRLLTYGATDSGSSHALWEQSLIKLRVLADKNTTKSLNALEAATLRSADVAQEDREKCMTALRDATITQARGMRGIEGD